VWVNVALDGGLFEIDATIVPEADETVPPQERVADRLAETAFGLTSRPPASRNL
jgi:hypothetical protein